MKTINFNIDAEGEISLEFKKLNILDFAQAVNFVQNLPYGRNANKGDLKTIFLEKCGTCSSKHALLKQVAIENGINGIHLIVGIFKMNRSNTPKVTTLLLQNKLEYLPEAHCYLKSEEEIIDVTKANSQPSDFIDDLITEIEIQPNQITDFKVAYHKNYLKKWLVENKTIKFSVEELWQIREQCIGALANINATRERLQ